MTAQEAYNNLDPQAWAKTSAIQRLHLLEAVRDNMLKYGHDLAKADSDMKNNLMGEELYTIKASMLNTVVPLANSITACHHLYEHLIKHGEMPKPEKITKIKEGLYNVEVKPLDAKERLIAGTQKLHLRVKGTPKQINPMDKPAGVIAVSGAGNYSSSLEMVKAMFLENCAVIHKPHRLNEASDKVWEKIFQPLIDAKAIAFIESDQGRAMTTLEGLKYIYFTGSTAVAKAIDQATDTTVISECGGNNPCIIVPGDQPWTAKEIEHQAIQIATIAKLNGGAVCGRIQTIITSKNWPQRHEFMRALEKAIEQQTPAMGTYYPNSDQVAAAFVEKHPQAKVLKPEGGKYKNADFIVIENVQEEDYSIKNEAFCQIINEIALDTAATIEDFLPQAVAFANDKLLGTLGASILIDEKTKAKHNAILEQAKTAMAYGGLAINTMPPFIFLSPYLTWGGNEEGKEFVSGVGNFGNVYGFENIEKSILEDNFVSMGHMLITNKTAFDHLATHMAKFSMAPTWMNLTKIVGGAVIDSFRGKDF